MTEDEYLDLTPKVEKQPRYKPLPRPQYEPQVMREPVPRQLLPVQQLPIQQVQEQRETMEGEVTEKKGKKKGNWWSKSFKPNNFKKPTMVAVIFLKNNGRAVALQLESKRGFFNIEGKTYHERRDCTWIVGKERIPLAIIPEWSLIPIGTTEWEDKPMLEKFNELQDHTLKGIRHAELVKMGGKDINQLPTKKIILYGVIALVAVVVLMNYL